MMKKLLLALLLIPFLNLVNAQEEIVKWTFPTGQLGDTVQNGTNPLNLTRVISIDGTDPITMTNGQASGDYAATATGWDDGFDTKYWLVKFKTTGYGHVKISSKQRAGGTNGGPRDFKLQYRLSSTGAWNDIPNSEVILGNEWTTGVVDNLDLPAECQNQSTTVNIRWVMTTNTDVNGGTVAATGVSKIDEIVVTGNPITGIDETAGTKELYTYPNPSAAAFSVSVPWGTTGIEIFNSNGQMVLSALPDKGCVKIEKALPAGLYFVIATMNDKAAFVKHIIK